MEKEYTNIPNGWISKPFGSLISEQMKSTIKVSDASGFGLYPFFTSGEDVLVHDSCLIDGETIYLATGGQANVKYYNGKAAYSTDTYAVKCNGLIDTKLLYYYTYNLRTFIDGHCFQGSGLKHIQKRDLKRIHIPYPEKTIEQQQIVRILSNLDKIISNTENLIQKYREIKEGLIQDLLTRGIDINGNIRSIKTHRFKMSSLGMIPVEWNVVTITHYIKKENNAIKTGPFGSALKKEQYSESGYKVYGQQQVISGDKNIGDYYINELLYQSLIAYKVQKDDILISCMGTIGNVLIITEPFQPGIINPRLIKFSIDTSNNDINFFAKLLESDTTQRQLMNMAVGGTMPSINKEIAMRLQFVAPPHDEQIRIVEKIQCSDALINEEIAKLQKLQLTKSGLLQDLLYGKVRIPETINI